MSSLGGRRPVFAARLSENPRSKVALLEAGGEATVVSLDCAIYPTIAHLFADGGYALEKLEKRASENRRPRD